ncbi:MAG: glycosyltransferase family 2 protein [Prevotella sp.]|nr:glycosyltransferase family 2 protein [Prevotella sp.]
MNDKHILVSFILTYYNQPLKMVRECLNSILALSLRPAEREIIIVDDGSAESPMNELLSYGDDIIYVRQRNTGAGGARNTALQLAKGEYLQFVDADDLLNQAAYEHCLDLVRYSQPDMVVFDFTDRTTHGSTFTDEPAMSGAAFMRSHNLRGSACCYIFSRAMLGALRFSALTYHEDEEFTPQLMLHANSIVSTDAKAYVYRRHGGSITRKKGVRNKIKMLTDNQQAISSLQSLLPTLPTAEQQALQRRLAQLTMDYIYNIIVLTRSRHYLDRKLAFLTRKGLFPLPDKNYTRKYKWFRRLTNSSMGRTLLLRLLPLMKRER